MCPSAVQLVALLAFSVALSSAESNSGAASHQKRMRRNSFLRHLDAAVSLEADLDAADEEEYTDYVVSQGKLDGYLDADCNLTRRYRAYELNKRRIADLNAYATRSEVVHGTLLAESYGVNAFTDCDDECRAEYLESLATMNALAERRRLLDLDCIQLSAADFADADAANSYSFNGSRQAACGAVKNQGSLGSCWAFSSTAQLQCNFNTATGEARVFSDKYATDCSTASEGSVVSGGFEMYLTDWYTEHGACADFHKAYDGTDETDYDGDCICDSDKEYGQCYEFYPGDDAEAIANAAQLHALTFGVYVCSSFFDASSVWYGCGAGDAILGGHAMAITGQRYGSHVLVRNSWGANWGLSGALAGHVWFHESVWSSAAAMATRPMSFSYFAEQEGPLEESTTAAPALQCGDTVSGRTSFAGDEGAHSLELDAAVWKVTLSNCDSAFDTTLSVVDHNGAAIDGCDDCGSCAGNNEQLVLSDLQSGLYRVLVGGYGNAFGEYALHIDCDVEQFVADTTSSPPTPRPTPHAAPTTRPTSRSTPRPTTTPTANSTAECYAQGPCRSGFMDVTDGAYNYWGCGRRCEGGRFWTDDACNCACVAAGDFCGDCASLASYDNFNVYRYAPHIRFFRSFGWLGDYVAVAAALALLVAAWWMSLKSYAKHLAKSEQYASLKVYDSEVTEVEQGDDSEMERL